MNKSAMAAFFLSFIPGAGHFYLQRNVRALVYALTFFGLIFLGFLLAVATHNDDPLALAVLAIPVWFINMFDMIITLLRNRTHLVKPEQTLTDDNDPSLTNLVHQRERFYMILLSPIPGLSHFQLGLMIRGVAFLVAFFGTLVMILFVTALTRTEGFLAFLGVLPIIWLYSLFDAVQLVNRKHQGEVLVDRTVFEDFEQNREQGKKSRVIAMLLSVFPGAGHMYIGLQKRGFQLMVAFLLAIYVLDVMHLSLFLFLIPLIWFYSFFDALQQLARFNRGEAKDVPVIKWLPNHQRWMGIALLVLGGYYLLDQVLLDVLEPFFPEAIRVSQWLEAYFQTFIVSTLLIGSGIRLIFGAKSDKEAGAKDV